MSVVDKAPEGSKFRAHAADALDGEAGIWGNDDLLCVAVDANGELVLGSTSAFDGVILTSEGNRDSNHPGYNLVQGGKVYTVFTAGCEFVELNTWTAPDPIAAGDVVNTAASGGAAVGGAGTLVGKVVKGEGETGMRLVLLGGST